ncbi:MAG: hypothetical protein NMNS01_26040 [Nitrosomonas sp.]|nr:MAG: hypothetical protein NMNS01_26040 [Nitrosomonas sp.]
MTGGQIGDMGQVENLLALTTESANALLDDKGYDSDFFIQVLNEKKALNPPFCLVATE